MITLLIFLLVLSILVFVHEFGHFATAKKAGLRVDEFGFGFPPRVFGIQKVNGKWRKIWGKSKDIDETEGGTVYSLNALPFGGFVKIKGESGEDGNDRDSFASRGALQRIWILSAGVLMNALLAVVLIAVGYTIGFPQDISDGVSKYAHVKDARIEIVGVLPDSPAWEAGMIPGSKIISVNGRVIENTDEFKNIISEFLERSVKITIEESGESKDVEVVPVILDETERSGIGVGILDIGEVRYPIWLAVPKAFQLTGYLTKAIVFGIGGLISDAIMGKPVTVDIAGPVGIAVMTGQAARQGFINLIQFMAILSVNLAILNIIPFPALDGGRILFIGIEKIRGKKVSETIEGWMHAIGFFLLIALVLFITYKDIVRYGGEVLEFFGNLI